MRCEEVFFWSHCPEDIEVGDGHSILGERTVTEPLWQLSRRARGAGVGSGTVGVITHPPLPGTESSRADGTWQPKGCSSCFWLLCCLYKQRLSFFVLSSLICKIKQEHSASPACQGKERRLLADQSEIKYLQSWERTWQGMRTVAPIALNSQHCQSHRAHTLEPGPAPGTALSTSPLSIPRLSSHICRRSSHTGVQELCALPPRCCPRTTGLRAGAVLFLQFWSGGLSNSEL